MAGFEKFLIESAYRIFSQENYQTAPLLLDRLRKQIVEEVNNGGALKDLIPFTKVGLKAYRLPWPAGEKVSEGVEKIILDDYRYSKSQELSGTVCCTKPEELASYSLCLSIIDDILDANIG